MNSRRLGAAQQTFESDDHKPASGEVVVLEDDAALAWLDDAGVEARLDGLYRRCPWSTRFQSREFITIWYQCYRATNDPILLYRQDGERLTGFFGLARQRETGRLVVAGTHQAEYQGWLAEPDDDDSFLQEALQTIKMRYRPDELRLRYLPAKAPTSWMEQPLVCGAMVEQQSHRRPLFNLANPERITESLKKKGNRSRLNRLKRHGELRLLHLKTTTALEAVIDQIIASYDLRQGAANSISPFAKDPRKRRFHLDLMAHPGLMQASVLTVGEEIAAAHLGIVSGDSVAVGIYTHSPFLANHSPGKFLMLMLGADLAAEGKAWIDLTPGGTWKDRFATEHDQVFEVAIVFNRRLARQRQAMSTCLTAARSSLALIGITPNDIRRQVRGIRLGSLLDRPRTTGNDPSGYVTFYLSCRTRSPCEPAAFAFGKDRVEDLLCVDPESWPSDRQVFLAACEKHLADGHHAYTRVEDGRLVHVGWLADSPQETNSPALPGKTVWLHDQTTSATAQGRDFERQCIGAILADVAGRADQIAVSLSVNDVDARRRFETLGFKPVASG